MVSLAEKKLAVNFLRQDFELSERRACALVELPRATQRYRSRRPQIPGLRERLVELAHQRTRFGYPRLHMLLRREGFAVNRKRVYRLYRDAGLKLRSKRRKRVAALRRGPMEGTHAPNERWSMDFVSDALSSGRRFRVLNIVDDFSKLSPAIVVGCKTKLGGAGIATTLVAFSSIPPLKTVSRLVPRISGRANVWNQTRQRGSDNDQLFHDTLHVLKRTHGVFPGSA